MNVHRERSETHPQTHTHNPDQHSTARYHHDNTHNHTLTHKHASHTAVAIEKKEKIDRHLRSETEERGCVREIVGELNRDEKKERSKDREGNMFSVRFCPYFFLQEVFLR